MADRRYALLGHTHAAGAGLVDSFISRTGDVVAVAGDYDAFYYTESEIDAFGFLTSFTETNDLTAAVVWDNIPIANVPTGTTGVTVALGNHLHTGVYEPVDATIVRTGDAAWNATDWDTAFAFTDSLTATAAEINLLDLAGLTAGWALVADSATTASWQALAAGGTIGGSITDNQIAFGATTADDIEGHADFTWASNTLTLVPATAQSSILIDGDNLSATTPYIQLDNMGLNVDRRVLHFNEVGAGGVYLDADFSGSTNQNGIIWGNDTGSGDTTLWSCRMDGLNSWSDGNMIFYGNLTDPSFRIYDAAGVSYWGVSHDGADHTTTYGTTTRAIFTGMSNLQIRNGGTANFIFTPGTGFAVRDGLYLRIQDPSDTDYASFFHNGTDFKTVFDADSSVTGDWDITGLTGRIYQDAETLAYLSEVGIAAEVNDLTAAVTWDNIPIANVPTGTSSVTVALGDHLHASTYLALAGGTMAGDITMAGNDIIFASGGKIDLSTATYLDVQGSSDSAGGVRVFNNSAATKFNLYYNATDFGLLDSGGAWVLKANESTNIVDFASGITALNLNIADWDTAFGWGDHASTYSLLAHTHLQVDVTDANDTNWDLAHGWGDHDLVGYALDADVVHVTMAESIAGAKTFTSAVQIDNNLRMDVAQPKFTLYETDAIADEKSWIWRSQGGLIGLYTATDAAPSTTVEAGITFNRVGTAISGCIIQGSAALTIQNSTVDIVPNAITTEGFRVFSTGDLTGLRPRNAAGTGWDSAADLAYDRSLNRWTFDTTMAVSGGFIYALSGTDVRVFNNASSLYGALSHDETDFVINTNSGGGDINFDIENVSYFKMDVNGLFHILNGADTLTISHDGTYANFNEVTAAGYDFDLNSTLKFGIRADWTFQVDPLKMLEQAAAASDSGGYGQFWVRTATPNEVMFTDDAGGDQLIDPSRSEINTQNGNYTLVLGDKGKTIHKASGGAGETITIPTNASVAFPLGTLIGFQNDGGDDLTIACADTFTGTDGGVASKVLGDNHTAVAQKMTATTWKYAASDL